jgi:hypothetical protein
MNKFFAIILFSLFIAGCSNKKKNDNRDISFFPVKSFIKSQISHVDTSVYTIIKIETTNGVRDTTYIKREEFSKYANEFLTTPDIASEDLRNDYKETNLYDELLEKAIINYTTTDKEAEVQRVEIIVSPSTGDGDKVESIFIDRLINNNKKTITKRMLWEVDKRYRISTISTDGKTEKVHTIDVIWNDHPSAE